MSQSMIPIVPPCNVILTDIGLAEWDRWVEHNWPGHPPARADDVYAVVLWDDSCTRLQSFRTKKALWAHHDHVIPVQQNVFGDWVEVQ